MVRSLSRRAALFGPLAYAGHVVVGAVLNGALSSGCGSTGGKLVELHTRVVGDAGDMQGFVNAQGWEITLERATIARGRLEYYTGDASLAVRVADALVPASHAHPGHYAEGEILGEVPGSGIIELTDGATDLPTGRGIAGTFGSAHLVFHPEAMGGAAVELVGEARRDGDLRRFIARAAAADVMSHHNEPEVWGCPFEGHPEVTGDGVVTLTVRPSVMLRDVRFELHGDAHADATPLDPLLEPFMAFIEGVRDHDAYVFSYQPV